MDLTYKSMLIYKNKDTIIAKDAEKLIQKAEFTKNLVETEDHDLMRTEV